MDGRITMDGRIQRRTFLCLWLAVFMCCGVGDVRGMVSRFDTKNKTWITTQMYSSHDNIDNQKFAQHVQSALELGASANKLCYDGHLALRLALVTKNATVLEMLLNAKADPNAEIDIDFIREPVTLFERIKRGVMYDILHQHIDTDYRVSRTCHSKILIYAIISGFNDGVKLLLDYGANPNISYHFFSSAGFIWNMTALHEAVLADNIEAVNALLAYGADGAAQAYSTNNSNTFYPPFLLKNKKVATDHFVVPFEPGSHINKSKVNAMDLAEFCINRNHDIPNEIIDQSIIDQSIIDPNAPQYLLLDAYPNATAIVELLKSSQLSRLKRMRWDAWRKYQHAKRLGVNLKKGFVSRFKSFMAMFVRQQQEAATDQ